MWNFLNSNFGIWLLSTVAVGAVSYLYARWQSRRGRQEETRREISKLGIEISARLDSAARILSPDDREVEVKEKDLITARDAVSRGGGNSVYSDLADRTTRSLLIRLAFLGCHTEAAQLYGVLGTLDRFQQCGKGLPGGEKIVPDDVLDNARTLLGQMHLPPWNLSQLTQESKDRPHFYFRYCLNLFRKF